jgi:hypothetical protein
VKDLNGKSHYLNKSNMTDDSRLAPLDELRLRLREVGSWPQRFRRLAEDIETASEADLPDDGPSTAGLTAACADIEAILDRIVDDELNGLDPAPLPPYLQTHLQTCARCQFSYQLLREALESTGQPFHNLPAPDLSFLQKQARPSSATELSSRATWRQTADQLHAIFFPATPQAAGAYRSEPGLDDTWFTLLRSAVEMNQQPLSIVLEAVWRTEAAETLHLQLKVGPASQPEPSVDLPDLRAHIEWGLYRALATITQRGRADFAALPLDLVWDEAQQRFKADLQLTLELV